MHWNHDKRTKCKPSFQIAILLAIWSLVPCQSVLSSGEISPGDEDGAIREDTGEIEVDDIEKDSGDDDIGGGVVEEESEERIRLFQYDPVEVKIPKFLTPEECERLKELALDAGLSSSRTLGLSLNLTGIDESKVTFNKTEWIPKLTKCDNDTDGKLDFTEVLQCLPGLEEGETVPPDMLQILYLRVKLDLDSNGFIDARELWLMNLENKTIEIKEWLSQWRRGNVSEVKGKGRTRISEQAWVDWADSAEPIVMNLRERVLALTNLDRNIVFSSEDLQVVRYHPGGRFHAHLDSQRSREDQQCIHTFKPKIKQEPRICRFMTILYYLQDPESGGETAFPLAEFENISKEYKKSLGYNYRDLSRNCYKNLYVTPEYGKAIMWYNHHIDEETGWMSSVNEHALHGGCDVTKGTKWIANNWITVDDDYERQMEFHAQIFQPRKDGEIAESGNETNDEENNTVAGKVEGDTESNDDISDQNNDNESSKEERSTPATGRSERDGLSQEHVEL
ncbi:transmembrane prolyl 4-hydroxylase-like [Lytechinus pictus]|uniref:transmembrane prolyl 4-hydroxylase-like n=1 Tax=Lytechinus pictus TaxID=7653 RepID=UPI0030B9E353